MCALPMELGEHAATEAYLAEMQRYVKARVRMDGEDGTAYSLP